jgi:hypothetical protein
VRAHFVRQSYTRDTDRHSKGVGERLSQRCWSRYQRRIAPLEPSPKRLEGSFQQPLLNLRSTTSASSMRARVSGSLSNIPRGTASSSWSKDTISVFPLTLHLAVWVSAPRSMLTVPSIEATSVIECFELQRVRRTSFPTTRVPTRIAPSLIFGRLAQQPLPSLNGPAR